MLTGAELFDSVDERLARADRDAVAAQQEADTLADGRDAARAAEAEALRALARLRLAALGQGAASIERLDSAERQVRDLLATRTGELRAAEAALLRQREALAAARAARDDAVAALQAAEAAEARALESARAAAEADPAWQRLRTAAEEAGRIAAHAAQKAALAHEDLAAKGRPYLQDPLFAYLWERGFGTPRYRGGGLARMLDAWTARVARFEPARRDYALLSALPDRLDAHAARMREEAASAATALAAAERRIAGLPAESTALAENRAALETTEQALEAAQQATAEAEARRTALADGQDDAMREAEARLEAALGAQDLRALREAARRTPTPEDDLIVARLEAAAAERVRLEREIAAARASAEAALQRRETLAGLRAEMRGRGWARDRWDFADAAMVGVLLGELLRGALSRDAFWQRMERHRVPAPAMPGGQAGGPWGPLPGPWGLPPGPWGTAGDGGGQGSWGGRAPMPGPWGRLPGGFRTGGGLGGGGFRTGGGMGGGGGFRTGGGMGDGGGFSTGGGMDRGGGGGGFRTGGGF